MTCAAKASGFGTNALESYTTGAICGAKAPGNIIIGAFDACNVVYSINTSGFGITDAVYDIIGASYDTEASRCTLRVGATCALTMVSDASMVLILCNINFEFYTIGTTCMKRIKSSDACDPGSYYACDNGLTGTNVNCDCTVLIFGLGGAYGSTVTTIDIYGVQYSINKSGFDVTGTVYSRCFVIASDVI